MSHSDHDSASIQHDSFYFNGDVSDNVKSQNSGKIEGFPEVRGSGWNSVLALEQTAGGTLSMVKAGVGLHNSARLLRINRADASGWINNNQLRFIGSAATASTAKILNLNAGSGDVIGNVVESLGVQVKARNKLVDFLDGGRCVGNEVRGIWADPSNLSASNLIDFNSSDGNVMTLNPQYPIYEGNIAYGGENSVVSLSNGKTIAGLSGDEKGVWQYSMNFNDVGVQRANTTAMVTADNTAQSMADMDNTRAAIVIGAEQSDIGDSFVDLVLFAGARDSTAVSLVERLNITRSYSRSGTLIQISIDDNGATYNVAVTSFDGPTP
ncbi:hypothetical protein SAMN05216226_1471 [Halovenus aranensis]|uniref:Uncharacterized protein n=1 Tax=Halovenus aranensis TaxID=890420 RepID=A0A1G9A3S0_9EURY|nr:hypothetical protein [Halovenus aranensis]SDK21050.1 hypothetical protein SAMN05216226_1471 [Halovenus aranensis]